MHVKLAPAACGSAMLLAENPWILSSQIEPSIAINTFNQVPMGLPVDLRWFAAVSARCAVGITAQLVLAGVFVGPIERHQFCSKKGHAFARVLRQKYASPTLAYLTTYAHPHDQHSGRSKHAKKKTNADQHIRACAYLSNGGYCIYIVSGPKRAVTS